MYKSFRLNALDSAFNILNTFLHKGGFKSYLVFSHSDKWHYAAYRAVIHAYELNIIL